LLRRAESYLSSYGATTLYAGQMHPLNPFYFGLYGGSDSPGFLASDGTAAPFLEFHGYRLHDSCFVFQRNLTKAINVVDGRFPALRRRYQLRVISQTGPGNWWQECSIGLQEMLEIRLEEVDSGIPVGNVEVWEMEGFKWRWGMPAAGILNLVVQDNLRCQGVGKFLLTSLLRYLQEQFFGLVEVQVMERNQPAIKTFLSIGFEQVDTGHVYKKVISSTSAVFESPYGKLV
jgi:ribosomal protein S18 acetylase RimI-like enzyme